MATISNSITLQRWLTTLDAKFDLPIWQHWLTDQGSLTERLTLLARGDFHVEVLREGWANARSDEHKALGAVSDQPIWVREVVLYGADQPWVYARTAMQADAVNNALSEFTTLGNRPLGAVLFNNPKCVRGEIDTGMAQLATLTSARPSRRSCFQYLNHPIIVAESFLPAFEHAITSA